MCGDEKAALRIGQLIEGKTMKRETDIFCKCKGILFRVNESRVERSMGHRVYQCDRCKNRFKFGGPCEQTQMFMEMTARLNELAREIVEEMAEYDATEWDK